MFPCNNALDYISPRIVSNADNSFIHPTLCGNNQKSAPLQKERGQNCHQVKDELHGNYFVA
jgi:hypothetical protein